MIWGSLIWYVVEFEDYGSGGNSIGYNMYTFVDKQYGSEDINFVHVEGVGPTDETIFDETYPIVIYNYIYHDENNKFATEFANKLYQYLMSEEGQQLISDAGYINVKDQIDRNASVKFNDDEGQDNHYYGGQSYYDEETGKYYKPAEKGYLQE